MKDLFIAGGICLMILLAAYGGWYFFSHRDKGNYIPGNTVVINGKAYQFAKVEASDDDRVWILLPVDSTTKVPSVMGYYVQDGKDLVDRMYNFLIHYVPVYDKTKNEDPKKYEMSISIRDDYHKVRFKHFKDFKSNDRDGERIG